MPSETFQGVILLVLALGYFSAGLHLDRRLLWVGVLMGAGCLVVTWTSLYASTVVGVTLAVALAVAGAREARSREATP